MTILESTSSEQLCSLDDQYECQKRWEQEPDKLSLIIEEISNGKPLGDLNATLCSLDELEKFSFNSNYAIELQVMIGDKENRKKGYAKEALEHFILAIGTIQLLLFFRKCSKRRKP